MSDISDATASEEYSRPSPVGVFDSGLGGLSVAWEIHRLMPANHIVYVGDTAHVPYGPRSAEEVREFSMGISSFLIERAKCRVIVVACNTAVSAGIVALRERFAIPIVAIEPGIKPAVAQTRTGKVGVLATVGTAGGERLHSLINRYGGSVEVLTQPCPGLVECVEQGDLASDKTRRLVEKYVLPLKERGVDTLVLGCTHYPFLRPLIAEVAGNEIALVDTGEAVARQAARVAPPLPNSVTGNRSGIIECQVTGELQASEAGFKACFAFFGDLKPPLLSRLRWRGKELYDNGAN